MAGKPAGVWVRAPVLWVSTRERRKHLFYFWNDWSCTAAVNERVVGAAKRLCRRCSYSGPDKTPSSACHPIRSPITAASLGLRLAPQGGNRGFWSGTQPRRDTHSFLCGRVAAVELRPWLQSELITFTHTGYICTVLTV